MSLSISNSNSNSMSNNNLSNNNELACLNLLFSNIGDNAYGRGLAAKLSREKQIAVGQNRCLTEVISSDCDIIILQEVCAELLIESSTGERKKREGDNYSLYLCAHKRKDDYWGDTKYKFNAIFYKSKILKLNAGQLKKYFTRNCILKSKSKIISSNSNPNREEFALLRGQTGEIEVPDQCGKKYIYSVPPKSDRLYMEPPYDDRKSMFIVRYNWLDISRDCKIVKHAQPAIYTVADVKLLVINVHINSTFRSSRVLIKELRTLMDEITSFNKDAKVMHHLIVGDFNIGGYDSMLTHVENMNDYNLLVNNNLCLMFSKNIKIDDVKVESSYINQISSAKNHNVIKAKIVLLENNLKQDTYIVKPSAEPSEQQDWRKGKKILKIH
jgi:hypothetical protein